MDGLLSAPEVWAVCTDRILMVEGQKVRDFAGQETGFDSIKALGWVTLI